MWKNCEESNPLKASVIETLTKVISCGGSDCHTEEMYNITFPMLYEATSGTVESSYLVRDGITMYVLFVSSMLYIT